MQIRVENATGKIVAYGQVLNDNDGEENTHTIYTLDDEVANIHALGPGTWIYNVEDGTITVIPPAPPPPKTSDERYITREIQTTNATPQTITLPLAEKTGYFGDLTAYGVQEQSPFDRILFKKTVMAVRATGNAILDGQPNVHPPVASAGASGWTVVVSVSGQNLVITCTGQAGKTINWTMKIYFSRFNREGLVD